MSIIAVGDNDGTQKKPIKSFLSISVFDLTTGQPLTNGQTLTEADQVQATVTTTGTICDGFYVATEKEPEGGSFPLAFIQGNHVQVGAGTAYGVSNTYPPFALSSPDTKFSASCGALEKGLFGGAAFEVFLASDDNR